MKLPKIKENLKIKFKIFNIKYLILFVFCSLFFILPALAQTLNTGLEFGAYTGLVDTDIRIIVARIIRAALGLLGIVALVMLIYGGYEYMTAAGNEEQISKAKKILLNAAIGLAIILSAFAITQFVISKLTDAIIGDYTSQYCQQNPTAPECAEYCLQHPVECNLLPLTGNFYAASAPQGKLPIKNVVVRISFFNAFGLPAPVDPGTINASTVKIAKLAGGQAAAGDFQLIDNNTGAEFHPTDSCIDPESPGNTAKTNPSNECFEKNTAYQVEITTGVRAPNNGVSVTCNASHPCLSTFTTGDLFDRLAPTIKMTLPGEGALVMEYKSGGSFCPAILGANFTDDSGVQTVKFYSLEKGGEPIASNLINPWSANGSSQTNLWQPVLTKPGQANFDFVYAQAFDLDDHNTVSAKQKVKILPASCFNGILDTALGEEQASEAACQPDCGQNSQCGACQGEPCREDTACASGWCAGGYCVNRPKITNVMPPVGAEGNYITIYGQHFGPYDSKVSQVNLLLPKDTNPETYEKTPMNLCRAGAWQDNQIVVEIPAGAKTGPVEVVASSSLSLAQLGAINLKLLASNLAGYWTFDEADLVQDGLNFKALDKSGHNLTLTTSAPKPPAKISGQVGQALQFDGSQYLSKADDDALDFGIGSFSLAFWFKTTAAAEQSIVSKRQSDNSNGYVAGLFKDGRAGFYLGVPYTGQTTNYLNLLTKAAYNDGRWHHYAGLTDRAKAYIYLDGQLENKMDVSALVGSVSNANSLIVGAGYNTPNGFHWGFQGSLDDVRLYNRFLSIQEIQQLFLLGQPEKKVNYPEFFSDTTHNDFGPWFDPKDVLKIDSKEKRPGLCSLTPAEVPAGDELHLSGKNLGESGKAWLGATSIDYNSADQMSAAVSVPVSLKTGQTTLKLETNGNQSNPLSFTIVAPVISDKPHIEYIDPTTGPTGAYLTIFGQNFGAATGKVTFKQGSEPEEIADLPNNCGNPWSDTQIVVKVPDKLNSGNTIIWVIANNGKESNKDKVYNVDQNKKQANLCKVEPDNGPKGTVVTLKGEGFAPSGYDDGRVVFSPFDTYSTATSWTDKIISGALVPDAAKSGPVQTITYGIGTGFPFRSNSLNFKVQDCQELIKSGKKLADVCPGEGMKCCVSGSCLVDCPEAIGPKSSVYAWSFSTGKMPIVPQVVEECASNKVPSPTPSKLWPPFDNVCLNAQIKVRFNNLINEATIDNHSFLVEDCSENCDNQQAVWKLVGGKLDFSLSDGQLAEGSFKNTGGTIFDTVAFQPVSNNNLLLKNEWYRVTLTTDIKSTSTDPNLSAKMLPALSEMGCVNPAGKIAAYCFAFKTQDSDDLCKLGKAVVSPDPFTATIFGHTYYPEEDKTLYSVSAIARDNACWVINAKAYVWQWNVGYAPGTESMFAQVSNDKSTDGQGEPVQDLITKNKETPQEGVPVWASTGSGASEVKDSATLKIILTKPQIIDYWPACEEACINAAIGANFSLAMNQASLNNNNIILNSCSDKQCQTPTKVANYTVSPGEKDFILSADLFKNNYYQVFVKGGDNGVKSAAGGKMNQDYSWIFKTKNDDTKCDIDRVEIYPASSTVYWVGDKAIYRSLAFGPKDNCSKTGQMLKASDYNWQWLSVASPPATLQAIVTNLDLAPATSACSANCLEMSSNNRLPRFCVKTPPETNCCGNNQVEMGEEGNNEDCELGAQGCDGKCQLAGSSYLYNPPSFCGDGIIGIGEDCEPDSPTDKRRDPLQYAIAQSPTAFQEGQAVYQTQIFAQTLNLASQSKQGQADFTLQCGYKNIDANCPTADDSNKGVGKNSCCYPRPTVQLIQPAVISNVCPNTAIILKFNQLMDINSFSSSTLGYYNIILAEATSTAQCPIGQFKVAEEIISPKGFWQKIVHFVRHLFGQPVQAEIFCAGGLDYSLSPETIMECHPNTFEKGDNPTCTEDNKIAKTQVSLILKKPLAKGTGYRVKVEKSWVKSQAGVSLTQEYEHDFYTFNFNNIDLCKIDKIEINPASYWFSTTKNETIDDDPADLTNFDTKDDVDKVFTASAYYSKVDVSQEIQPLDAYNWKYSWSNDDTDNSLVEMALPGDYVTSTLVKAKPKNGLVEVGAQALIITDLSAEGTVGQVFNASSTVQVFICENPWPDSTFHKTYGLGYVDAAGNQNNIPPKGNDGWSNFKLMYCRDYGHGDKFCLAGAKAGQTCQNNVNCGAGETCVLSTADDLPELRPPTVLTHEAVGDNTGIFKEFFATFKKPSETLPQSNIIKDDKDSLGLRVYTNLKHLPLLEWYQADPALEPGAPAVKGAPVPKEVGPYEALQDGRTYYINGINVSGTTLYTNVYVFSFSDNPTAETLNIVNQLLLANFALNVEQTDKSLIEQASRDLTRLRDLNLIAGKLLSYYTSHKNSYPKLTENPQLGTYLPSYTNSKWKSWQGVLGNLVGYTLPVDPINKFKDCNQAGAQGLVAWWKGEGDAKDAIGSYDGELKNGVTFEAGKTGGQAFSFDGSDDYISTNLDVQPSTMANVSWEAWVYPRRINYEHRQQILSNDDGNYYDRSVLIEQGTANFGVFVGSTNLQNGVWQPTSADVDQWQHIVVVYTPNNIEFYKNGNYYSYNKSPIGQSTTKKLYIGKNPTYNQENFQGLIDEIKIYNRDLTSNEVKAIYSESKDFDPETCWNAASSIFACPKGSHVYQYETKGGETATLKADFERSDYIWEKPLTSPTSAIIYQTTASCVDAVQGISEKCGDGIVGMKEDGTTKEECEIGQTQYVSCTPLLDNSKTSWDETKYPGLKQQKCNTSCSGFEDMVCVPQGKCEDGVKQTNETCDDGKNNGKYGYCSSDCKSFGGGGYCGNKIEDKGKEVCDSSSFKNEFWCEKNNTKSCASPLTTCNAISGTCLTTGYIPSDSMCGSNGPCVNIGAKYAKAKADSCSWDCQSYDYCGDGKVNNTLKSDGKPYEECEGSKDCQVGVCDSGANKDKYCEQDTDCASTGSKCVTFQPGKQYCQISSELQQEVVSGSNPIIYKDGTTKFLANECQWSIPTNFQSERAADTVSCLPFKAPEPPYSPINCGNGKIDTGEDCDNGLANGVICTPVAPATTCTYCAFGCQQVIWVSK